MEEKTSKNKKQLVIGGTILLLVTLLLLGLTYAYYRTKIVGNSGEKSVNLTSKNLEIIYQDGDDNVVTETVDEENKTFTKKFSVANTGGGTANFSIKITGVENTFSRVNDWTYEIKKSETTSNDASSLTYGTSLKKGTVPNVDSYLLFNEEIGKDETNYYEMTLSYNYSETEDQSDDMGKKLNFKIDIDNPVGDKFNTAESSTLLASIGKDNSIAINSSGTKLGLAMAEDNDGTSYYFTGYASYLNNNFVTMGNTCWRIVRVQGDGNIKIVLYDETHPCTTATSETGLETFISSTGDGSSKLKQQYSDCSSGENCLKFDSSKIKSALNDWYGFSTPGIGDKFAGAIVQDAKWCNDTSFGAKTGGTEALKCDDSYIVTNKIALLTASEFTLGGLYLTEGQKYPWWTMTSDRNESQENYDGYVYMYKVGYEFQDYGQTTFYSSLYWADPASPEYVRPALVLKKDAKIQVSDNTNGTKANPYEITTS